MPGIRKTSDKWNNDEDAILRKMFPLNDNKLIATELNKSIGAVRARAIILRIKKSKHYWKPGQEKYIIKNYGKIPIVEMIEKLQRTRWAVINKYRELSGLRKTGEKTILSK